MLKKIANVVRGLSADAIEQANSGHPGLPIGAADIGAVLYGELMKYDPSRPNWPDRDRFVLSAGHGSMLLYSFLHLAGYDLTLEDLKNFRQFGSRTPGHPEYGETEGVETTTGPLGQGFANAVGMALAEQMMAVKYNTAKYSIVDHYTYTLIGDGGMMEGVAAEAASLAGHLGLGKLIAIYDDNEISIAGSTDLAFTESVPDRFRAYHWHVIDNVDGHDIDAVKNVILEAKAVDNKPTLIVAKTHIAYGAPTKQDSSAAHGAPLGEEEIRGLKKKLGLPEEEKFYVSAEVKDYFKNRAEELQKEREAWDKNFSVWSEKNPELRKEWDMAFKLELPAGFKETILGLELPPAASRKTSGTTLQKIAEEVPYLIGGSADLAPSNKTYLDKYAEVQKGTYKGRNLRFGVREHAMGAIANGISVHQGLRPFVSTFLVFSDYMRPAVRMAALMNQPVVYIFTHDSIYVGEDGPTHQPVEHVEALRTIPNLLVLRPADEEETKAAWIQAMERTDGPTALILTRQNLPHLEKENGLEDFYRGGYVIQNEEQPDLVLMASGSEVSLAVEVADLLQEKGKTSRIVSIPERSLFAGQDREYIEQVLGSDEQFRVALEAGIGLGWYRLLGRNNHLVSLETFGASGPGKEVGQYFGFTADKIAVDILKKF